MMKKILIGVVVALTIAASTTGRTLTVESVRELAVSHNRDYLSSQQELVKAGKEVVGARAGAFPQISFSSGYTRNFLIGSFFVDSEDGAQELKFGFDNNFNYGLSLRQTLWEGGRVWTAIAAARQYRQYWERATDGVEDGVLYQAEGLFYTALQQEAHLAALEDALKTYEHNVEMVQRMYDQGVVSQYELLRAQTERANILPQLLNAQSEVKLSRKRLLSFLGLDLAEESDLKAPDDDTSLVGLPDLSRLVDIALAERPEMDQSNLEVDLQTKAIKVARADWLPSLAAVSAYSWESSSNEWRLNENISKSFTAGLTLSLSIFDGGATASEVGKARAARRQAELAREDTIDDIRLEVEAAYDQLLQAKKSLDVQTFTIAQAEEGLRIANLRYEAGEGTLLDVLSAQTALTQARTTLADATYAFRLAGAGLKKATTKELNELKRM